MNPKRTIRASVAAGLLVVLAVIVGARLTGASTGMFTRDPAVLAGNLPFYAGSVSILTCVAWGVAAALALFVASVDHSAPRGPLRLFGLFALLLLADDALLLHEAVGPGLGVPELAFGASYAVVATALVWALRHHLRSGLGVAFLLGGAFLGASLFTDVFFDDAFPGAYLVEDGLKLIGVFLWVVVPVLAWNHGSGTSARTGAEGRSSEAPRPSGARSVDAARGEVLEEDEVVGRRELDVALGRGHEADGDPHRTG